MNTQTETPETKPDAKTQRKPAGPPGAGLVKTPRKRRQNRDSEAVRALKQQLIDTKKAMADQKKLDKVQAHEKKKLVKILEGIKALTTAESLAAIGEAYDAAQATHTQKSSGRQSSVE